MSFDVPVVDVDAYILSGSGDDEAKFRRWQQLLHASNERGLRAISSIGLLAGGVAYGWGKPVVWATRCDDPDVVATLSLFTVAAQHELVWAVPQSAVDEGLRHAFGNGVVCAVTTSAPATALSVGALRRELRQNREALAGVVGYLPTVFVPRSTDQLVREEARRAGFSLELEPRAFSPSIRPDVLADELAGRPLGRVRARIAQLTSALRHASDALPSR